jgi:hypothetical protein
MQGNLDIRSKEHRDDAGRDVRRILAYSRKEDVQKWEREEMGVLKLLEAEL